jgi:exopolysaccharide production protein ExoZ
MSDRQPVRRRLYSVQFLRGVAAAMVVAAHIILHPQVAETESILIVARFGVEIFFVISGFVMVYITSSGEFKVYNFLVKRIARVVPLYWGCTLLVFACALYLPQLFKTTTADWGYLLNSLLFVPDEVPGVPHDWRPLFKLGYTLNYEMFFYVAFALTGFFASSRLRVVTLTCVMGAMILGSALVEEKASVLAFYLNLKLMPFIAGMWLAEGERTGVWDKLSPRWVLGLGAAAAIAVAVLFSLKFDELRDTHGQVALTLAASLLVLLAIHYERNSNIFSLRPAILIGDVSYSLYLTHMFVVGAGWYLVHKFELSGFATVFAASAMFVISVVAAYTSYRLFEKPSIAFGNFVSSRASARRPPPRQASID